MSRCAESSKSASSSTSASSRSGFKEVTKSSRTLSRASRRRWRAFRCLASTPSRPRTKVHTRWLVNEPTPASFLFIFVLFKHKFYRIKAADVSGFRTRIVGVEGEHAYRMTTTMALWTVVSCNEVVRSRIVFFKNGPSPASLTFIFGPIQTNITIVFLLKA